MARMTVQEEFDKIDSLKSWNSLFMEIKEESEKEAKEKQYSLHASSKESNRSLNRYRDVNPYDHSRIIIHRGTIDYINANLVKLERAERKYILTQGPLKETIGHFWLMIWEQNSKAIVMLNKLLEKKQIKCHMYWPEKIGSEHRLRLPDVGLIIEYINSEDYANYSKRIFRLTDIESKQAREVIQFHYTTWPDFGIPSSPVAFLQFLKKVRESGALEKDVGPAVVHCSAGIGRSGTFCLVDCYLVIVHKKDEVKISVKDVLYELRRYRMGLIQTSDQLYFSYKAIIDGINLLNDPDFNNYEEVPQVTKNEEFLLDIPPPLPPRVQSLTTASDIEKPLPMIPNSESVCEELVCGEEIKIECEKKSQKPSLMQSQEQLYKDTSLKPELMTENISKSENLADHPIRNENPDVTESPMEINTNNNKNIIHEDYLQINLSTSKDQHEVSHMKRRKRTEKQMALDDKIHDIKRKQKELEDNLKTNERRKSLMKYVLAGVAFCSICVYMYSKFN